MDLTRTTIGYVIAMLLLTPVLAFPLYGDNGVVNATVFGTMKDSKGIIADVAIGVNMEYFNAEDVDVELVDSEGRRYMPSTRITAVGGYTNGAGRKTIGFDVPSDVVIEKLRVVPEPNIAEPFTIDWVGMPEVSNGDTTLKFYGVTKPVGASSKWGLDVKLSNTGGTTLDVKNDDFKLVDQFGWKYDGYLDSNRDEKLLPGESLRYNINVDWVSPFSRPVALTFKDMELDISAWA